MEGMKANALISRPVAQIPSFLFRINVPDDVVWQTNYLVTGSFRHLGEPFRFGLIFERVRWEIDACAQYMSTVPF